MQAKCGWAGHLGEALSSQLGLCMQTEAVAGSTVRATAWLLPAVLRRHRPKAVVIGLSPANDGLEKTQRKRDAEALGDGYLEEVDPILPAAPVGQLRRLVSALAKLKSFLSAGVTDDWAVRYLETASPDDVEEVRRALSAL